MEFWDHLDELRGRLWRVIIYLLIATCVGFSISDHVYTLIITGPLERAGLMKKQPELMTAKEFKQLNRLDDLNLLTVKGLRKALERKTQIAIYLRNKIEAMESGVNIITDTPISGLVFRLETGLVVGLILAFPLILIEIWGFVVPALTPTEKHYMRLIFPTTFVLFVSGVAFAYLVAPTMIAFLVGFNPKGVIALWPVQKHVSFLLKLFLGVGIAFQMPLVIVFLGAIELVSHQMLKNVRRHAFVMVFVIAAIVTPTWDPVNLTICALPLYLLYEIGLIAVWFMERARRKNEVNESMSQ
jgi:sec-independent protein translocase protein TatC